MRDYLPNPPFAMKPKFHRFQLFPVVAAGLLCLPMTAQAQDDGRPPIRQENPSNAPGPEQIQAMMHQLQELQRAGKADEARPIAERLRAIARQNAQLASRIENALNPGQAPNLQQPRQPNMREARHRPMAQPDAAGGPMTQPKPEGQPNPAPQPNAAGPRHQMPQPNAAGPWHQMPRPNTDGQPPQPAQPNAAGPRQMNPPAPGGQPPQPAQPHAAGPRHQMAQQGPQGPQGQGRQMAQPKMAAPWQQMGQQNRPGGWGPQMPQSNMDGQARMMFQQGMQRGQWQQMARPNRGFGWGAGMQQAPMAGQARMLARPGMQAGPWQQMLRPQRTGRWGPGMQQAGMAGQRHAMFRWNHCQGGQCKMMGWSHRGGGRGPGMQQPQMAAPGNMMFRRNMQGGQGQPMPQPKIAQPNLKGDKARQSMQADQSEVGKIRHLRQAAEHLAAAGFTEQAAKARQEVSRMEAALKQAKPASPAPADKAMPRQAPRREMNQPQAKPEGTRAPDVNAELLGEMRKLHQQIEQLSARMQKLEAK